MATLDRDPVTQVHIWAIEVKDYIKGHGYALLNNLGQGKVLSSLSWFHTLAGQPANLFPGEQFLA